MRALSFLVLAGCVAWEEGEAEGLRTRSAQGNSGANGRLVVEVPVETGDEAALLTVAMPPEERGYTAQVVDPSGAVAYEASSWWDLPQNKTNGGFASAVVTMQWPVSASDAQLTPGRWTMEVRTEGSYVPFEALLAVRAAPPTPARALRIRALVAAEIAADADLYDPTVLAFEAVRDSVYADLGVDVELVIEEVEGAEVLGTPGYADHEAYLALLGDKALREVPVIVVKTIRGAPDVFGAAGGIPGPLLGTDRSAVTISALLSAGGDGRFNAGEQALYAETIAHEVGHYLGLFHPAELPRFGDAVTSWDALPDTPECTTFDDCSDTLGGNLMFPTPICAEAVLGGCEAYLAQRALTAAQSDVALRYVGVQ